MGGDETSSMLRVCLALLAGCLVLATVSAVSDTIEDSNIELRAKSEDQNLKTVREADAGLKERQAERKAERRESRRKKLRTHNKKPKKDNKMKRQQQRRRNTVKNKKKSGTKKKKLKKKNKKRKLAE